VIAEYQDLSSAERAVRWLERQGISIQNVSIVDEAKRFWRKSHPAWARRSVADVRRYFLLGATASLVLSPLSLGAYAVGIGLPLGAKLTWILLCGTSVLGGTLSALYSLLRRTGESGRPRKRARFTVILRSDAATLAAVGHFFPRARPPRAYRPPGSARPGH
jgi:hypothetical protein